MKLQPGPRLQRHRGQRRRTRTPVRPLALLNALAGLYLKKRAALQAGGENMPEFFAVQVKFHREKFDKAREALESFQEKDNIVHIGQEIETNLARLMAMEGTLKDLQAEIESSTKEIAALEEQIKDQPEEVTKDSRQVLNPEVTAMRQKLVDLERQRDELLQRYQPSSRFVKDKENEIATLRAAIAAKEQNVVGETLYSRTASRTPSIQQLLAKRVAVEAATRQARRPGRRRRRAYEERLDVLKDRSFDLARAARRLRPGPRDVLHVREEGRGGAVSRAMDEENIVNAGVIQEAKRARHPAAARPPDLGTGVGDGRGMRWASPSPSSSSSSASPSRTSATSSSSSRCRCWPPSATSERGHRPPSPRSHVRARGSFARGSLPETLVLGGALLALAAASGIVAYAASPVFVPLMALALIGGALVVWRPEIGVFVMFVMILFKPEAIQGLGAVRSRTPSSRWCSRAILVRERALWRSHRLPALQPDPDVTCCWASCSP